MVHNRNMRTGRPRQFNQDRALSAATTQFWRQGYAATSLQDLLQAMRLSKSSLYQSFGSKDQLFALCIEQYQTDLDEQLRRMLSEADSGQQFVETLLSAIVAEASSPERKGCLLVNTANELAGQQPAVATAVNRGFNRIKAVIEQAFYQDLQVGKLPEDFDVDAASDYLVSGISGLRTMVKAGVDQHRLERVVAKLGSQLK